MNFKEYIEQHRNAVYSKICEYIPVRDPEEHYRVARDYIDRQGSYRRPGLLLLANQVFGGNPADALLPAAAMQLSEDWILMQDDLEDDSELRRGKPAAHRLYGMPAVIDASDSDQMAMWRMLKDYVINAGPEKGNAVYEKFYRMLEYTVEGQYVENKFIHKTKDLKSANESLYMRIVDSKTCFYTVYGPLQLGALAAGVKDEKTLEALHQIGQDAGVAFQITDDVLDMIGDEKKFGKKNLGDLYEGKITLMVLRAYELASAEEKAKMDSIYIRKRQEKTEQEIFFIRDMIEKYKGIEYAKQKAKEYGQRAAENISKYKNVLPQNEYTNILMTAMEELYVREK